mmetsp:Transcript_16044/g.64790  ORF Transcript_16044/g.64790 Transcript_16044/m.64790 type:complete len:253 (-) Transcript_16044:386-1144(-)
MRAGTRVGSSFMSYGYSSSSSSKKTTPASRAAKVMPHAARRPSTPTTAQVAENLTGFARAVAAASGRHVATALGEVKALAVAMLTVPSYESSLCDDDDDDDDDHRGRPTTGPTLGGGGDATSSFSEDGEADDDDDVSSDDGDPFRAVAALQRDARLRHRPVVYELYGVLLYYSKTERDSPPAEFEGDSGGRFSVVVWLRDERRWVWLQDDEPATTLRGPALDLLHTHSHAAFYDTLTPEDFYARRWPTTSAP